MIIARSPLRITLGGGGTDLQSYYRDHGGFLIAAAIDRHVYVTVNRRLEPGLRVRHAEAEATRGAEPDAPIIREALALLGLTEAALEITSFADLPAGTGLGSSGSFTTALLLALLTLNGKRAQWRALAESACHIEIDRLAVPAGKQDPYIAAHGGITVFDINAGGRVRAAPLRLEPLGAERLQQGLVLFYTGLTRRAGTILREQEERSRSGDAGMLANLHKVKELGLASQRALETEDFEGFAALMDEHWQHKKRRAVAMTNPQIDAWYELAMRHGALGGKLIGAGGGGFLMFYTADRPQLCQAMAAAGLAEVPFRFSAEGTRLVLP